MAINDGRPDHAVPFIGHPDIKNPSGTGAPGSASIGHDPASLGLLTTATVTTPGASSQPAQQPTFPVDAGDTGVPAQAAIYSDTELISAVDLGGSGNPMTAGQSTGPGYGGAHVCGPGHPNAPGRG